MNFQQRNPDCSQYSRGKCFAFRVYQIISTKFTMNRFVPDVAQLSLGLISMTWLNRVNVNPYTFAVF